MGFPAVRVGRAGQLEDTHTRPYRVGRACVCGGGGCVSEKGAKTYERSIAV